MTDTPLTKSKLAKELGITRQSINTWIKRGDLVFDDTGKMSIDEFNRQLGHRLHPVSKIRDEKYSPTFNDAKVDTDEIELDFHAARTIREIAEAKTSEFKLNVMKGDYVERIQVDRAIFERARQFRDGLMGGKKKLAPNLSGLTDIKEIETLLDHEFRALLDKFSNLPPV